MPAFNSCIFMLRAQEKSKSKDLLFSIQSEGLVCNYDAVVYVIAVGVWHHALACIYLRIDSIQGLRLDSIPQQVADYIHAFGVICEVAILHPNTKVLVNQGLFVFL